MHFADVAARVARLAARLAGVTYSVTAHATDRIRDGTHPEVLSRALAGATAIIGVTDFDVAHLRRSHPAVAATAHRIYAGVELDRIRFSLPESRPPRTLGAALSVAPAPLEVHRYR